MRARVGRDFLVVFRVSSIDLVEGGLTAEEIVAQAKAVEAAGADIINQGIGWHEARVPTIAQKVPRAAWAFAARRLKEAVRIPVIASNRINTPDVAEAMLARGDADLVSMARPMLADPEFANKAREGRADEINVCIACNQACLDLIFSKPRGDLPGQPEGGPRDRVRRAAAGRGQAHRGGGRRAGGARLRRHGGRARTCRDALRGGNRASAASSTSRATCRARRSSMRRCATIGRASSGSASICNSAAGRMRAIWRRGGFDEIVIATGVTPRVPDIAGIEQRSCASYVDILDGVARGRAPRRRHRRGRHRLRHCGVPDVAAAGRGGDARAFPGRVGRR